MKTTKTYPTTGTVVTEIVFPNIWGIRAVKYWRVITTRAEHPELVEVAHCDKEGVLKEKPETKWVNLDKEAVRYSI